MIEWKYIVVLLCFLLLVFLFYKEIKRKNKHRLLWRIIASIIAVTSLACIALPITYHTTENHFMHNEAVLLTEGFNSDSVSNFISKNSGIPVFFLDKNSSAKQYNAQYVADVSLLLQQQKNIRVFHLFGYGSDKEELNNFQDKKIIFHPSKIPGGITTIHWQQKLRSGDKLIAEGTYNNTANSKVKIVLSSFAAVLDSVFINANAHAAFSLATIPKNLGKATCSLTVILNKDTIEKEIVPVQVEQGERLKILMLASSPDFDNKFLKTWLAQDGYVVAARTIISKDKYAFDLFNTTSLNLNSITSALLRQFDVVIADAAALTSIPKSELATLQSAIAQKGAGLIVKEDSIAPAAFYNRLFPLSINTSNTPQQLAAFLLDTLDKIPALATGNLAFIRNQSNTQPLVFDKQNKVYVSSALYGAGKIVFSTLTNTYSWALAGNEEEYKKYWATLLNKAASTPVAGEAWSVAPALPRVNTPVQLQLQTSRTGIPQGEVNGTAVYLKMNPVLPYQWSGTYYPNKMGWQTAVGLNGKPFYWYVFDKMAWKTVYASQKITATLQCMNENLHKQENTEIKAGIKEIDFPKLYFFIVLLISCSFLWLENKYTSSAK